jgi:translation elongation factor EF-Ts
MHVAASAPEYVSADEIPQETQDKVRAEFSEKAKTEGKPPR